MPTPPDAQAPVRRWVATSLLVGLAVIFSSNHVAARLAFDHGVSVITAVTVRSAGTALSVFVLLRIARVPLGMPRPTLLRALALGGLLSIQSYCLYAAVARLPVGLALLTFNTFPMLLALIAWARTGQRPATRTLIAIPCILFGLALALGLAGWLGAAPPLGERALAGVAFGLTGALTFAVVLFLTPGWLGGIDGRLRSMVMMSVVALIVGAAGLASDGFAFPVDAAGWTGLVLLTVLFGTAFTCLFTLLPRLGIVNNSAVMNIEPISAMLIAWLALGQSASPVQLLGALIVVGAIVFLSGNKR